MQVKLPKDCFVWKEQKTDPIAPDFDWSRNFKATRPSIDPTPNPIIKKKKGGDKLFINENSENVLLLKRTAVIGVILGSTD